MRHHHRGDTGLLADLHQLLLQIAAGEGVEGAKGFIKQQQPRLDRQGPGDGHPLLHTAGEFGRELVGGLGQPDQRQAAVHLGLPFAGAGTAHHPVHRQGHVLAGRLPGQQGVVLEHHHPVRSRFGHLAALHQDAAAARLGEAGHQVEQGALAAARVAD